MKKNTRQGKPDKKTYSWTKKYLEERTSEGDKAWEEEFKIYIKLEYT